MRKVTKQAVQNKADRCLDLYLPLDKIVINSNVSLWVNTCDNARTVYPRRANLRLSQMDVLPHQYARTKKS